MLTFNPSVPQIGRGDVTKAGRTDIDGRSQKRQGKKSKPDRNEKQAKVINKKQPAGLWINPEIRRLMRGTKGAKVFSNDDTEYKMKTFEGSIDLTAHDVDDFVETQVAARPSKRAKRTNVS